METDELVDGFRALRLRLKEGENEASHYHAIVAPVTGPQAADAAVVTVSVDDREVFRRQIDAATSRLAENPSIARPCDDIRDGYRVLLCGSHSIYFRTTKDAVLVVRILHARMDPERNL